MTIHERLASLLGEAKTEIQTLISRTAKEDALVGDLVTGFEDLLGIVKGANAAKDKALAAADKVESEVAAMLKLTVTAPAGAGSSSVMVKADTAPALGAAISHACLPAGTTVKGIDKPVEPGADTDLLQEDDTEAEGGRSDEKVL